MGWASGRRTVEEEEKSRGATSENWSAGKESADGHAPRNKQERVVKVKTTSAKLSFTPDALTNTVVW
jgi:hypothetical protein